jgi:hypothetical protein
LLLIGYTMGEVSNATVMRQLSDVPDDLNAGWSN